MDQQRVVNIEIREQTGKGVSRQLRSKGLVPAVVYGKGIDPVPVSLNPKELVAAIAAGGGQNTLLTLKGGGSLDGNMAIIADMFLDPLKNTLRHVDLHRVNLAEKVRVEVKINLMGTAAGVKEGGLLDFTMHAVEIECLPTQIPEHIDVDITDLALGHSVHVGDLQLASGVKLLTDPRASVVSVLGKAKEEAPSAE
ncbi:50S ribosomal protein L25 [Geobacter sp. DSM 9736]|uniref:50S ribosomal protein L25 n=1 Tax=Geobacter sp. DSM 9736 TaxID=1277350 RepID=UPI000B512FC2|nr:50S ribosomal protein L25 [Geobacter sp. DSM 9736]SNB48052.1 LSU ribosomal protein L25P [Geobacter sp. DSM 9736]